MKGLKGFNIFSNQRKAYILLFLFFFLLTLKKKSKQHLPKGDLDLKTVHYII